MVRPKYNRPETRREQTRASRASTTTAPPVETIRVSCYTTRVLMTEGAPRPEPSPDLALRQRLHRLSLLPPRHVPRNGAPPLAKGVRRHRRVHELRHHRHHEHVDETDLRQIFDGLDQDHTGVIKYSEFLAASMDERLFLDERRIVNAFNKLDVDRSGSLSKENLRVFLGDIGEELFNRCFNKADVDKSGQLSLSEFRALVSE